MHLSAMIHGLLRNSFGLLYTSLLDIERTAALEGIVGCRKRLFDPVNKKHTKSHFSRVT